MRRAALILLALASVTMAVAQRPWVELDEHRREQILASKHISAQLRESYPDIAGADNATREALWQMATTPVKEQRLASLYLYIYELLRHSDGTTSHEDLRMLTAYPDYHLTLWQDEGHDDDIYNYAFNIAKVAASGDRHATALLRPLQRRRLLRRHGEAIATLMDCATFAEHSIALGRAIEPDHTLPRSIERLPQRITAAHYHEVVSLQPLGSTREGITEQQRRMIEECERWDGGYYSEVEHPLGRDIVVVEVLNGNDSHIAIIDSEGTTTTLPSPCYILNDGAIHAVAEHGGQAHIIIAHMAEGCITHCGAIALGEIATRRIKCDNTGIYFEREGHYLHIPKL